jgi:hypothetical protein
MDNMAAAAAAPEARWPPLPAILQDGRRRARVKKRDDRRAILQEMAVVGRLRKKGEKR